MNFNDLITKYPDESLRQAISDAYQVGYDEGVQAAAGKVIASLGELRDSNYVIRNGKTVNVGVVDVESGVAYASFSWDFAKAGE